MTKKLLILSISILLSVNIFARNKINHNICLDTKAVFMIGAYSPIIIPGTVTKVNDYKLALPNIQIGLDLYSPLYEKFDIALGINLEQKEMQLSSQVHDYPVNMEEFKGVFTGINNTNVKILSLSLNPHIKYSFTKKLKMSGGIYLAYCLNRNLYGSVEKGGSVRVGGPTGNKVILSENQYFNFSKSVRKLLYGLNLALSYKISMKTRVYSELEWGLNGIQKKSDHSINEDLYPIYAGIGFSFSLL